MFQRWCSDRKTRCAQRLRLLIGVVALAVVQAACGSQQAQPLSRQDVQRWLPVLAELSIVHAVSQPDSLRDSLYVQILENHHLTPADYRRFREALARQPAARQLQILRQVDHYVQAILDSMQAASQPPHGE